jgi:hypothetical protein
MKSKLEITHIAMRIGSRAVMAKFFIGCHYLLNQKRNTEQNKTLVLTCKHHFLMNNAATWQKTTLASSFSSPPSVCPEQLLKSWLAGEPNHRH